MQSARDDRDKQMTPSAWEECKKLLRNKIPAPLHSTFIQPLRLVGDNRDDINRENAIIKIASTDRSHHSHIQERYLSVIHETLLELNIKGQVSLISHELTTPSGSPALRAAHTRGRDEHSPTDLPGSTSTDAMEEFYGFRELSASIEPLFLPAASLTVLTLSGPSGIGKTLLVRHLLNLLGSQGRSSRYMTLEGFLTEFTVAIQDRKMIQWREKLRTHSILVIDNFQFMKASAKKSQEELRNLIDDYSERGQQLVLISDTPFERIPLQNDLSSRIVSGMEIPLLPPEPGVRGSIARGELENLAMNLPSEAIEYLIMRIPDDMRRLKSAVRRTALQYRTRPGELKGIEWIDALCKELYSRTGTIDPQRVIDAVAGYYQVPADQIIGASRDRRFTRPRHLAAYILSQEFNLPLSRIATAIGRRDHTAVVHALKKVRKDLEEELFLSTQIQEIIRSL